MSDQDKKKPTFLTETSNIGTSTNLNQQTQHQQSKQQHEKLSVSNSNSEQTSSIDADEEDDDYYDYEDYQNPFYQYTSNGSNSQSGEQKAQPKLNIIDENLQDSLSDNRPISAIAPKIYQQDEGHTEISSTPAFQHLEEVN